MLGVRSTDRRSPRRCASRRARPRGVGVLGRLAEGLADRFPREVEPAKPGLRRPGAGGVEQDAVLGRGEAAAEVSRVVLHSFGDGHRIARQPSAPRVEALGHEDAFAHVQKVARRVDDVGARLQEERLLARIEVGDEDRVRLALRAGRVRARHVEEVAAVGQERDPALRRLAARGVERGRGLRRPARGGNTEDAGRRVGRVEDHAVPVPRAAAPVFDLADRQGRSPGDVDLLELLVGEERQEAAVRRPEREASRPRCPEAFERRSHRAAGARARSCRRPPSSRRSPCGRSERSSRDPLAASATANSVFSGGRRIRADALGVDGRATQVTEGREARGEQRRGGHDPRELLAVLALARRPAPAAPPASRPRRSTGAGASRRAPSGSGPPDPSRGTS